jgi:hypothetical protein
MRFNCPRSRLANVLSHSLTLTLLSWYLILPPTNQKNGTPVAADAPLREWDRTQQFGTAAACEEEKKKVVHCGEVLNNTAPGNMVEACGYPGPKRGDYKDKQQNDLITAIASRKIKARCVSDPEYP